jgi:hypothetical protein
MKLIFNFMKSHLINFILEKIIKETKYEWLAIRANFDYLIKSMASQKPSFLTNLINKSNSQTDPNSTIPFNILYTNLKIIFTKFIDTLFTKLNYKKILTLYESILLYTIQN